MRQQRPLRLAVLVVACLLMLGAVPLYFGIRTTVRDPVFDSLDALAVPGWAATEPVDAVDGSWWCFVDCRFRERILTSGRGPDETAQAYEKALTEMGWQSWKTAFCPDQPVEGHYSCWRRDELTLDVWVRPPTCATVQPAMPSPDPQATAAPACAGSVVSMKVRNAVADERLKPQPSTDPSLTGEDPDPVFTDDPLEDLTPAPS
jgi:integrin beta 3